MLVLAGLLLDPLELVDARLARLVEQAHLDVLGISIANTRNSPSSSSSTSAWRVAPGVFLYAASSASSSAGTSVPSSMPFSRSISRMASMISWLMLVYPSSIRLPRTISSYGIAQRLVGRRRA